MMLIFIRTSFRTWLRYSNIIRDLQVFLNDRRPIINFETNKSIDDNSDE